MHDSEEHFLHEKMCDRAGAHSFAHYSSPSSSSSSSSSWLFLLFLSFLLLLCVFVQQKCRARAQKNSHTNTQWRACDSKLQDTLCALSNKQQQQRWWRRRRNIVVGNVEWKANIANFIKAKTASKAVSKSRLWQQQQQSRVYSLNINEKDRQTHTVNTAKEPHRQRKRQNTKKTRKWEKKRKGKIMRKRRAREKNGKERSVVNEQQQQVDTTSVVPCEATVFSEQTVLKRNRRVYIHSMSHNRAKLC